MRLLIVADLHYALPQYDWLMDVAGDFDVVIIAGDHLDTTSLVDFRAQTVVVQKYLGRLKDRTQLITCSGNHDLDSKNEAGEKVTRWILRYRAEGVPTDGDCFVIDDTLFTICPWWDGPIVRETISRQLATDAPKRLRRWVWVHHAPPDHSPVSWGGGRYFGDVDLARWITEYQPDIVFSGHVHQSPFVKDGSWVDKVDKTWVFNAGHQFGAPPAHIVVDTEADMALWFSAAGNQFIKLSEPLVRPVGVLHALPDWFTSAGRAGVPNPA